MATVDVSSMMASPGTPTSPASKFGHDVAVHQAEDKWDTFLKHLDSAGIGGEAIKEIETVMEAAELKTPLHCLGLATADVNEIKDFASLSFPARALLKRAVATISVLKGQQQPKSMATGVSHSAENFNTQLASQLRSVSGREHTHHTVINAMQMIEANSLNIKELLTAGGYGNIPYHLVCSKPVWALAVAETRKAREEGRQTALKIPLTDDCMLAAWITKDMVGAKVGIPGEDTMQFAAGGDQLRSIDVAIKQATGQPRWFRSFNQWLASYEKFFILAVCTGLYTREELTIYRNTIIKFSERCRQEGSPVAMVILYDALFRDDICDRAMAKDPDLVIIEEMGKVQKNILAIAKGRLPQVVAATGEAKQHIQHQGSHNQTPASSGADYGQLLLKQSHAQSSAASDMKKQQEQFLQKQAKMLEAIARGNVWVDNKKGGGDTHGGGKGGGKSRRGANWVSEVREYKRHKGAKGGGAQQKGAWNNQGKGGQNPVGAGNSW